MIIRAIPIDPQPEAEEPFVHFVGFTWDEWQRGWQIANHARTLIAWCDATFGRDGYRRWGILECPMFVFKSAEDALHFRMRWG